MGRNPLPPRGLTSIRLDAAVETFLDYAAGRAHGDRKASNVLAKKFILGHATDALGAERPVFTLTGLDFEKALNYIYSGADEAEAQWRRENGRRQRLGRNTKGSRAQARTALRQFAEHCHKHKWLDPTVGIPAKEIIRDSAGSGGANTPKERLARAQWPAALEAAGRLHMRTRMAVALCLLTSRRVSEAVGLQYKHVDFANENLTFWNQKRRHTYNLAFINGIEGELRRWVEWARETYGEPQPDWYLVPSRVRPTGANSYLRVRADPTLYPVDMTMRSSTESVIKDVRKILAQFGIEKGTGNGTHTLRRSCATDAAFSKGIYVAKILLDHENVATTQAYVGVNAEYQILRDAFAADEKSGAAPAVAEVIPFRRRDVS